MATRIKKVKDEGNYILVLSRYITELKISPLEEQKPFFKYIRSESITDPGLQSFLVSPTQTVTYNKDGLNFIKLEDWQAITKIMSTIETSWFEDPIVLEPMTGMNGASVAHYSNSDLEKVYKYVVGDAHRNRKYAGIRDCVDTILKTEEGVK